MKRTTTRPRSARALLLATIAAGFLTAAAQADFIKLNIGQLPYDYAGAAVEQTADGRYLLATDSALSRQNTFGLAPSSAYSSPQSWYPGDLDVYAGSGSSVGVIAGYGTIYTFDPSNLATDFSSIHGVDTAANTALSAYNWAMTFRDQSSLYIAGLYGTQSGGGFGQKHALGLLTLSGSFRLLIDNIDNISSDFDVDLAGNVYVSTDTGGKVYKFTAQQLAAVTTTPLTIADGQFITALPSVTSLAVDSLGRIWSGAGGFGAAGLFVYDPASGQVSTLAPSGLNSGYRVSSFTKDGIGYISYSDTASSSGGATIVYGYQQAQNVPEPAGAMLVTLGLVALVGRRRG